MNRKIHPEKGLQKKDEAETLSLNIRFRHAGDMFFPVNAPGKTKVEKVFDCSKN